MKNSMITIIGNIRHLCLNNRITPENIKITIEFLEPCDMHNAEIALRMASIQSYWSDPRMIDSICSGNDFTFMGFKFAVKNAFREPSMRYCLCPHCAGHK